MSMTIRHKVRFAAIIFILGYAVLRFFFVRLVLEGYGVNPWVFLTIDVITGVVYVVGIEHLVLALTNNKKYAISWPKLLLWSLATAVSFAAPYLYIYATGRELPVSLGVGIGVIVVLLLLNAIINIRKRIRQNKHE
jgi:hypothetical protein